MRTWDAWVDREGAEELDLEDYRAIGGMGKALSIHADEIFGTFKKESTKDTATRCLEPSPKKVMTIEASGALCAQQLADITNKSIDEVKRVIEPYRQPGVTFIMPPTSRELEPNTVIDISHESLMRVCSGCVIGLKKKRNPQECIEDLLILHHYGKRRGWPLPRS